MSLYYINMLLFVFDIWKWMILESKSFYLFIYLAV